MYWKSNSRTFYLMSGNNIIGYVQKNKEDGLYDWRSMSFMGTKYVSNMGTQMTLERAKEALQDFYKIRLSNYGLKEVSNE